MTNENVVRDGSELHMHLVALGCFAYSFVGMDGAAFFGIRGHPDIFTCTKFRSTLRGGWLCLMSCGEMGVLNRAKVSIERFTGLTRN